MGRFLAKDTWHGDATTPSSYNRWNYVNANPINYADPSGLDPWWCSGQISGNTCGTQAVTSNEITSENLKAVYNINPAEALNILQQEFGINIPPGYQFRFTYKTSSVFNGPGWFDQPPWQTILGAGFWFTGINGIEGTIFEISNLQCGLYSSERPSQATYIDYGVYITDAAFTHYNFRPDDVAGTMLHEALHAWQESIVRDNRNLLFAKFGIDPSSLQWAALYHTGMERQAIDATEKVNNVGTLHLSQQFLNDMEDYKDANLGGPDFPIQVPIYGTVIR